jgi:peptide/nickel transport system substrate-binding protein
MPVDRLVCGWQFGLVFESDSAMPELPAELARSMYLITRQHDAAEPSGTGPFRLTSLANGVASLAENTDYWQGRPFVDTVQVEGKRSLRDQWLDLSVGRADIVEVPAELLHQALQDRLQVLVSRPTDLLVLSVSSKGALHDDQLRQAIALAVDRSALFNVIFQKEGEPTGSLLPADLTGYAFLFPTERDLTRARNYRAGVNTSPLVLTIDNPDASMQLVAERIVLNLREAGLNAQVRPPSSQPTADLLLQRIHLEAGDAAAGLNEMLEDFSQKITEETGDPETLYKTERDFLKTYQAIPLLYLPRALAVSERVRDLRLAGDGTPMIADVFHRWCKVNLRQKMLAMIAMTVMVTVAAVGWTVSLRVRHVFEKIDRERTADFVGQFRREYQRRADSVALSLDRWPGASR